MSKKEHTRGIRTDPKLLKSVVEGIDHDLFRDPVGRALLRSAKLGIADDQISQMIQSRVERDAIKRATGQTPPIREPNLHGGELELGASLAGRPVRIPVRALAAGWLLVANTGSGKTNLLAHLLPQIASSGVRVWVTDMHKQQHRLARHRFLAVGSDLIILRPQDSRFNMLQAAPNEPAPHLSLACDLLIRLLGLPSRARTILRRTTHELYERFGIWRGQIEEWPTLYDLYEAIREAKGLNPMAKEAILDRLASLLTTLTSKCAAYRRAWSHADLSKHHVVFEMAGASELVKHAILLPTIFGQFLHRISRGVVNKPMDLYVMLDDAQRFLQDSTHIGQGELPPFLEAAGLVRGAGIGLGVAVQSMKGVPAGLPENLAVKSLGRLGSIEDKRRMYAEVGLDPNQQRWANHRLQPGTFITQLATGTWRHPFAFQTPLIQNGQCVSEADVQDSLAPLQRIPTRFAEEFRNWTPYGPLAEIQCTTEPEPGAASHLATIENLTEIDMSFLQLVEAEPGLPASTYSRRMKIGGSRAKTIRDSLVQRNYIRLHTLAASRRGRPSIAIELLEKARTALGDEG